MTPRAVTPRVTSNRDFFGRPAPKIEPTDGEEGIMAPNHRQQDTTAEALAASFQEDRGVTDGVKPLPPSSAECRPPDERIEVRGEGDGDSDGNEEGELKSSGSFGSVTQEAPARVRSSTWTMSFIKRRFCCDCVSLSALRGVPHERTASAPETFTGAGSLHKGLFAGRSVFRPRHRRGYSTGSIAKTGTATRIAQQPRGWEGESNYSHGPGSATTSAWSSDASSALATAAASVGDDDRGSRRSPAECKTKISVGEMNALDGEFQRVLKAGVDVFKHTSANEPEQWADAVPRRLKSLLSRRCLLDDENEGLVTLFLDKSEEHLCWWTPGAVELVPDESYQLGVRNLVEVVRGDEFHPRFLSLRALGRRNPLVIEFDSDELYDMVYQGIVQILEQNVMGETLVAESPAANSSI